jgi:hypothetical protein
MDEQISVEQPATDSAPSVTDLLEQRWSEPDEQPQDVAPDEDNANPEGGDATTESEPQDAAPAEESEDVEFEGKTYKVPAALKDALLRQSDYTRKTQEVAEVRKALEGERQFMQLRDQVRAQLTEDIAVVKSVDKQIAQYAQVDWASAMDQDPISAQKAWMQFHALKESRSEMVNTITAKEQQLSQAEQQRQQQDAQARQQSDAQAIEKTRQHAKTLPGWTQAADADLARYVQDKQLPPQAVQEAIKNPVFYEILFKAAQFDKLQSSRPQVEKRVANLPKPVKPGSSETRVTDAEIQSKKAVSRLKQTGSPSALRDVLALRLKG